MGKEPFTTDLEELIKIRNLLEAGIATDITPITDVVGEVDDAADETVGITATIVSYVKGILTALGARADAASETVGVATSVMSYIKGLVNALVRKTSSVDFWSDSQETFTIPAVAADTAVTPTVTVAGLPSGCTLLRAVAMFKYRKVSAVAASALAGAQQFQVDDVANTGWLDCINLEDNQFTLAAGDIEGGDVLVGSIDIKARVDGNDTYDFQLDEAVADSALVFTGIQVGLRIWYR